MSYYMLPNNHIFFNLLNGTLFHFAGDKVFTGKLISLICFWGIIVVVFLWLSGVIKKKFIVVIATIVLAFQFPTWGFGFEARGYELYALAEWFSFFALLQYVKSNNSQWLYYFTAACIIGYGCIPTFLYFHLAFLFFGLIWMAYSMKIDMRFWMAQLSILGIAFLLYLPAICFSGLHAIAGNQYVTGRMHGLQEFYDKGIDAFTTYLNFYTSNFTVSHSRWDWMIFLAPLALFFFYRNRAAVLGGLFYVAMWLACIGLAYAMKIYAIDRTMGGQLSISLGLTVYVACLFMQKLNGLLKSPVIADSILIAGLLILGARFGIGNKSNISFGLYNNDINVKYNLLLHEGVDFIPKGSSVAFSDECFYWYYLCKLRGDKVSKCATGDEQYFVRLTSEQFPADGSGKFKLVKTVFKKDITSTRYEIYKKN